MRTETIEKTIFKFEELSESAKEKAIQTIGDFETSESWWAESTTEHFKNENIYFEVDRVYFSGFHSQGDGAMFEYSRIKQELEDEAINSLNLPQWKKKVLRDLGFFGTGKHSGRYYHENSCSHISDCNTMFNENKYPRLYTFYSNALQEVEDYIIEKYKDMCRELYSSLEKEYEYLYSEKYAVEAIRANEYEFNEDGTIY